MTEATPTPSSGGSPPAGSLPLISLLFVASGAAALIYEVVWLQLLQLVIGSTAISLGVLLATFMGGLCLGSLVLPRVVSPRAHPLRVYAVLELGIGSFGLVVLWLMPDVARLYSAGGGSGLPGLLLRGLVSIICLLPPTLLMGATLPALARWVEHTPRGVSWLGLFYGANIAGAVAGCLLAGFYLLRLYDMAVATYLAAAINATAAIIALTLAIALPYGSPATQRRATATQPAGTGPWPVYVAIALSGMAALGAEVVWTRLLSLMLGPTVYTFSMILAVFLVGLGVGSGVASLLTRWTVSPRLALAVCQGCLVGATAWAAWMLARSVPYWPVDVWIGKSPWLNFQIDLARCLWAILPPTCLWGASFPFALAAASVPGQDPGRLAGRVYAANTLGAIVGAVGFSLVLVPVAGTPVAERALICLSAASALLLLVPNWLPLAAAREASAGGNAPSRRTSRHLTGALAFLALIAAAVLLARSVPQTPWGLIAFGRFLPSKDGQGKLLYAGEGLNSSVAVTELSGGVRNFHVSGKIEASTDASDMRMQRMLGHLPALVHPHPRSVLVVGCGAGVTAGSFTVHPEVEQIVICEIEPLIPRKVAPYFGKQNYDVVNNPRVQIVYDDARHHILTTPHQFDIITSDPIHPWVKGAATLYTKEYFELVKQHLRPGGLVTQWVPLYESNAAVVKSEIATFFEVFPQGTVWSNDLDGEGYDLVLLGQVGSGRIDLDRVHQRLQAQAQTAQSLKDVGFPSLISLFATYAGQARDLRPWLAGADLNRDLNLRLQYLAGMGLNLDQGAFIYDDLLAYRQFPEDLFSSVGQSKEMLRLLFERAKGKKEK